MKSDFTVLSFFLNLHLCSLNVQGLAKYEAGVNFQHYFKRYDIVGLYETWGSIMTFCEIIIWKAQEVP